MLDEDLDGFFVFQDCRTPWNSQMCWMWFVAGTFGICSVSVMFYDLCNLTCTVIANTSNNSGWIRQGSYRRVPVWNCRVKGLHPTRLLDTHFTIVIFKIIFHALKILYIFYSWQIFVYQYDSVFVKVCVLKTEEI